MEDKSQLKRLIRSIIRETVTELLSSPDQQDQSQQSSALLNPGQPPVDAMTPMEKAKHEREQEKQRRDALKASEEELKTAKKEQDFQKQKVDQSKRFKIPTLTKQIQHLKGGVGE